MRVCVLGGMTTIYLLLRLHVPIFKCKFFLEKKWGGGVNNILSLGQLISLIYQFSNAKLFNSKTNKLNLQTKEQTHKKVPFQGNDLAIIAEL